LECLEDRVTPSIYLDTGGVLHVACNSGTEQQGSNIVTIDRTSNGGVVASIQSPGGSFEQQAFAPGAVSQIMAGGSVKGNDFFYINALPSRVNAVVEEAAGPGAVVLPNYESIQGEVDVYGNGGGLALSVFDHTGTTTEYTVTDHRVVSNSSAPVVFSNVSALNLTGGPYTDTYNIQDTPAGATTTVNTGQGASSVFIQANEGQLTVNGGGPLSVNVGFQGRTQGITNNVTLNDAPSHILLTVDDSADTAAHTVTVGTFSLFGSPPYDFVQGLSQGAIFYKDADTSLAVIDTGTGGNTVNVLATGTVTHLVGHGRDTVNVGSQGSIQYVQAPLYILNPPSYTTINLDDSADATARTVTLNQATVDGNPNWGVVSGLAPAPIYYHDADTPSLTVNTGTGGNLVNVLATGATTYLVGHGPDTVDVGYNDSAQGIRSALFISNPPSYTTINVEDWRDTGARQATLNRAAWYGDGDWGALSGLAPAPIYYHYADTQSINIWTNSASTVNVLFDDGIYTYVNGQRR
jgi:hypothetical protein